MNTVKNFEKWLKRSGFRFPKCRIRFYEVGDRGVEAKETIGKGEVVITVPDCWVLYPENSSLFKDLLKHDFTNSSGNSWKELAGLVICLMHEKCIDKQSRWYSYLQFLPEKLRHLPMSWDDLKVLKGTSVYEKMNLSVNLLSPDNYVQPPSQVDALFKRYVLPFVVHCLDGKRLGELQVAELARLFKWAIGIVSSYSFTLGDDHFQALVPLWDALNHRTGEINVSLKHCPDQGSLQMVATKDINKGEELVNCFGCLSSSELLRRFGFVEPGLQNPYNAPELSLSDIIKVCRFLTGFSYLKIKRRLKKLQKLRILPLNGWFTISQDGKVPESLYLCLKFLLMSKTEKGGKFFCVLSSNEQELFSFIARFKLAKLNWNKISRTPSLKSNESVAAMVLEDEVKTWEQFLTSLNT